MADSETGIRSGGPGGGANAPAGDSVPRGPWAAMTEVESWQASLRQIQLLLETGNTGVAMHELNDVLRQMTVIHERESAPPADVVKALGSLRLLCRDLPAWKAAAVSLFLAGVRPATLRQLTLSQCRTVVWDLATTLSVLERGGRA
jgi:hypothetical protein